MLTINEIIRQELSIKSLIKEGAVMGIIELADMASRMGYDVNILRKMLQDAFRKGGNEGVKKLFKGMTHLDLENISNGKFTITY